MKKSNTHEWVGFINSYSNTYTLKLRKVDSVTEKPLQNAVFALYGKYEEATDPSRIVRYTKPDGSIIILYYIKNAAPTDADGYTTIQGLHFSDTEKSYIYVLQETTVLDGYMTPIDISPEQVLEVTPSQIGNGTYALSMKNTAKTESLTIQKLISEQLQEKDVSYSIHLKITDTVNFAQAVKKYPFPYVIFNADETIAATGIFEEGTETVISIKAGQTIKIQAVPIGFTYELTEEITDATEPYYINLVSQQRMVLSGNIQLQESYRNPKHNNQKIGLPLKIIRLMLCLSRKTSLYKSSGMIPFNIQI